ncbi:MAG: helix-turn-helix transcriptional regulator [Polyangiales bacterium]
MMERLFVRLCDERAPGPETDAPAGSLISRRIPRELAPYVTSALVYREDLGEREVLERVVPDGAVQLAFNFGVAPTAGQGEGARSEAIGARTEPALVRLRGRMDGITVTLRPGAVAVLLGVPASELRASTVPLDLLWRGEASRWLQQLRELPDDMTRLLWLQRALLQRARDAAPEVACATHAARLMMEARGKLSVRALAASLGIGERRLQQLFQQHVGLSPRAYGRVARMHGLLRDLRVAEVPSWARIAQDAGFYDQAHLANEFRALCGLSPSAFLTHVSGSSKTAG